MPTTQPYLYIDPIDVEPYEYGLFGATQELTDGILTKYDANGNQHWIIGGVEWESLASYTAHVYPVGVGEFGGAGGTKALGGGNGMSRALPFAVYGGVVCGSVGYTREQWNERALRILELSGQRAAENALWTGAGGNLPALNATGTTDVTGGVATDITTAVGLLENWLGTNYAGRGNLHAMRNVAGLASKNRQTHRDQDNPVPSLVTTLGTRWVFGAGYDGTGPAAAAPGTGKTWIYATGQVAIARGDARAPASIEAELNRVTNQVFALAEQPYLIALDGTAHAAALVDLTK